MTARDRITEMTEYVAQACAALDNAVSSAQEVIEDPLVAAAHPALLEAQRQARHAVERAEASQKQLVLLREEAEEKRLRAERARHLKVVGA